MMLARLLRNLLVFVLFLAAARSFANPNSSSQPVDSIWVDIHALLKNENTRGDYKLIIACIDGKKIKPISKKITVIEQLINKLEQEFNLPAATYLGEYLVDLSRDSNFQKVEANARMHLSRYYSAMGINGKAFEHLEEAIKIHTALGNDQELLRCSVYKVLNATSYKSTKEVLRELDELRAKVEARHDTPTTTFILINLVDISLDAQLVEEAETYLTYLNQLTPDQAKKQDDYYPLIVLSKTRAKIALIRNDTATALTFYEETLLLSQAGRSRWIEVFTLQQLAQIELSRNNLTAAKSHISEGLKKAKALNAVDLLEENYFLAAQAAKQEKKFDEAYDNLEKGYAYKALLEERNNGFNVEKYYLKLEKEKLLAEKEINELELSYQKSQSRYAAIIASLILLLAISFFVAFARNRKERKKVMLQNELIIKQTEELKEVDEAKSRFFANISHELRTPLTLLTAPINTLAQTNNLTERQHNLLRIAQKSGKQLKLLVDQILDLQKIESGKVELNAEPTQIASFLAGHISQFESLAHQKDISYVHQNYVSKELIASVDQEKLRRVLINLLSNAFKFTPRNGKINVTTELVEDNCYLIVKDNGEGIYKEDVQHVFERYYQSKKSLTNVSGGTGIGLALCREYAQLFGGKIDLESQLGKGSRFVFSFPLVRVEALPEIKTMQNETYVELEQEIEHVPSTEKPTILLVEDNLDLLNFLHLILKDDYNVVRALNGKEGLREIADNKDIQLAVSDLMMPIMDGYTFVETVKGNPTTASLPIIMLTARTEIETKLKALRLGIDDYITKPFEKEELLARIENLLQHSAIRSESVLEDEGEADENDLGLARAEWLNTLETFVLEQIDDSSLTVPDIAAAFTMSESSLLRKTKQLLGLAPLKYLQEVRLDYARKLLETGALFSVKEIAIKSGFKDSSTFSRNYKKRFGKSPSDY